MGGKVFERHESELFMKGPYSHSCYGFIYIFPETRNKLWGFTANLIEIITKLCVLHSDNNMCNCSPRLPILKMSLVHSFRPILKLGLTLHFNFSREIQLFP